ncbi:MAG: hypothetical protein ACKVOI_17910 [Dongiaceae bacterium]
MSPRHYLSTAGSAGVSALRCAAVALFVAVLMAVSAPNASAGSFGDLDTNKFKPVATEKLANMRGGFTYAGMDISFGMIMRTAVNGILVLETAFNLENPGDATMNFNNTAGLTMSQTAQGFALSQTGQNIIHQMGDRGGGVVASVANALNNQIIQQSVTMNVGITNMNTIAGLGAIGSMLNNLGLATVGY